MRAQVVQDHHVAGAQCGGQALQYPSQKHLAVHGAGQQPWGARTLQAHAGDERAGLIAPVRDAGQQSFAVQGTAP